MRKFEVLFDVGEANVVSDPAFEAYGKLGFPAPPADRPWIYSNFVQSLDGIVSLKGRHATGADISQSPEDRWLMDLLRAHADAVLLGVNTLIGEKSLGRPTGRGPVFRGPVFRIMDPGLHELRGKLGRRREMNILVTGAAHIDPADFAVFDGTNVDAVILTTRVGAARLAEKRPHPHVRILVAGEKDIVPLDQAMRLVRQELDVRYLLCEGGPTLYGGLARSGLVDEKFLTLSPVEVGQIIPPEQEPSELERVDPPKMRPTTFAVPGFTKETAPWWRWISCRKVEEHQFSRYRKAVVGRQ